MPSMLTWTTSDRFAFRGNYIYFVSWRATYDTEKIIKVSNTIFEQIKNQ
jgi:hypothetical protein